MTYVWRSPFLSRLMQSILDNDTSASEHMNDNFELLDRYRSHEVLGYVYMLRFLKDKHVPE